MSTIITSIEDDCVWEPISLDSQEASVKWIDDVFLLFWRLNSELLGVICFYFYSDHLSNCFALIS